MRKTARQANGQGLTLPPCTRAPACVVTACPDGAPSITLSFGAFVRDVGNRLSSLDLDTRRTYAANALGLVYYTFRHYEPATGRWTQMDLIGERGGLNAYGICGNDSLSHADKIGLGVVDWLPIVSTMSSLIDVIIGHVPGEAASDYAIVSPAACKCNNVAQAESECARKVAEEGLSYAANVALSAAAGRAADVVMAILTAHVDPRVAAIFVADGAIALLVNMRIYSKIQAAASDAGVNNCSCTIYGY